MQAAERLRTSSLPADGSAIGQELIALRHAQDLIELEFARRRMRSLRAGIGRRTARTPRRTGSGTTPA
ncbi:MAG: hypothetical protein ACREQ5_37355 [Candidatus Dormibacteria bacterium]